MDGSCEKRHLSYELIEANRLANSLFSNETLPIEMTLAKLYASSKADMVIILQNELGKIIAVPYSQRHSPNYARKVRALLFRKVLPLMRLFKHFLFVTLTVNWTCYVSQAQVKEAVQKAWNRLNSALKREYPWVRFVKTLEWQSNGMGAHLHILLCGVRFIPKDWFLAHWIEPSGWAVELEQPRGKDPKSVLRYMLKYIAKSALREDENEDLSVSQVVNWATFTRAFSMSRDFSASRLGLLKTNSTNWVFLGVLPLADYLSMSSGELLHYLFYRELGAPPPWDVPIVGGFPPS